MQVLAGGVFSGEFPEAVYNPETGFSRLKLTLRTQGSMRFSLGGNISSTALNMGYAAFSYRTVGHNVSTYSLQGFRHVLQLGQSRRTTRHLHQIPVLHRL